MQGFGKTESENVGRTFQATRYAALGAIAALGAVSILHAQTPVSDPVIQAQTLRMDACERTLGSQPADEQARASERDAAIAAALAARRDGKPEQALAFLLRAHKWVGDDAVLLLDTGVLEEQMKLYKDANAALQAAHAADTQQPRILYALARVEMDLGQTAASGDTWRAYLADCPQDASAHYGYGLLLEEADQTEKAAAEFVQSIAIQPQQIESYYRLGDIRREQGAAARAAELYGKALARDPKHPGALTGLGILAFQAKRYSEAGQDLAQAVAYAPDFQTARYYYGLTLAKLGEPDKAQAELKTAIALANRQNQQNATRGRELASTP